MKEQRWVSGYSSRNFRECRSYRKWVTPAQEGIVHPKGEHWIVVRNPPEDIYERLRKARSMNYGFGEGGLVVNFRSALRASIFVMENDLEYILPVK